MIVQRILESILNIDYPTYFTIKMIEQARIKTIEVANEEKAKAKSEIADLINKAADKITNTKSDEKLYDDFLKEMK